MKMKPAHLFFLGACLYALSLAAAPAARADYAAPWGEQDAERNAQEEMSSEEKEAQEGMSSSVYGRITSIDKESQVLSLIATDEVEDKDEEADDDITPQDYHYKASTPLTGLDELKELSAGDYVTLDFYNFRDINRVTEITFDKHEEHDDDAPDAKADAPGVLVG